MRIEKYKLKKEEMNFINTFFDIWIQSEGDRWASFSSVFKLHEEEGIVEIYHHEDVPVDVSESFQIMKYTS